ncbi:Na+/H+ antiporter NhaC family protein [Pontiella sp. NLcol2]|uniref:Na+/H+ antiporter NhaC family protein n=2 Tax=Pontiella agarivorans TaxID=3038953 RepID=A0ABU5N229_9BACT|nr:Na+/H+ antiporter NhaC family protein [Pontiella agarivorans]
MRVITVSVFFLFSWGVVFFDFPGRALWPSVVALVSVFLLNRTITGLLLGTGAGLILLNDGHPVQASVSLFTDHLFPVLGSVWNLSVLAFTLLLGGFAALIEKGGGLQALTERRLASGKQSDRCVQWSAYFLGLVCFFDGLANSMLVGKSISPMAERAGVSKQRLAYIVDSTSSAVACVAVISTWIAYQLAMIKEGLAQAGLDAQPFGLFLKSIPFNFYCWFTLILLVVVISRDWKIGKIKNDHHAVQKDQRPNDPDFSVSSRKKIRSALIPLFFLIMGLLGGLYIEGVEGGIWPLTLAKVSAAYGNADAARVLVMVSVLACGIALAMNAKRIKAGGSHAALVFGQGVGHLFKPVLILIAAWLLSSVLKALNAHEVLTALLKGNVPPAVFPMLVFITGALISFITGTSWGTMGILMPLALPSAIGLADGEITPLIYATIAAVFSGAVFGDHCSPFSDTTIVSSISCDIEPMEHVKTQMPYALIAAAAAGAIGFLPAGLGFNPYFLLVLGTLVLFALPAVHNKAGRMPTVR